MTDKAIIETAARMLRDTHGTGFDRMAEAVLAAVTPLIEAAALERAAKVAENHPWGSPPIGAAIRALKEQP